MIVEPRALSFGRAAEDYERGRPGWPVQAVEQAVEVLALDRKADVVDLAAGTGKLTRLLTGHFDRVIAVEPDPRMRALLGQATDCYLVLEGSAEVMPLPDRSVDAVFVADAFHWFARDVALREIGRVMRPGGGLVIFRASWSPDCFDPPLPEWFRAELDTAYERVGAKPGGTRYGEWPTLFAASPFEQPAHARFAREVALDAARVVSLWLSVSSVASLPAAEHEAVRARMRSGLRGRYRLTYDVDLHWTRLRQPTPPSR